MIHHDYLLRLIEEFTRALSRIQEMMAGHRPSEAREELDRQLQQLVAADREAILRLSATEILARILRAGTAHEVHTRTLFLASLLRESGALAEAQGDSTLARESRVKALRVLLSVFERTDPSESPRFVPSVDALLGQLPAECIPPDLHAQVMHHFERQGRYADAENALFHLLDQTPRSPEFVAFGTAFYERLNALSDASLERGHLPRPELAPGLAEFQRRATA
jgi:hypothetical protein